MAVVTNDAELRLKPNRISIFSFSWSWRHFNRQYNKGNSKTKESVHCYLIKQN